jgi:hypothetical protein
VNPDSRRSGESRQRLELDLGKYLKILALESHHSRVFVRLRVQDDRTVRDRDRQPARLTFALMDGWTG